MSDGANLMLTTDHYVWAKEFVRIFAEKGYYVGTPQGVMQSSELEEWIASWIASAMCTARDNGRPVNGDQLQYMVDLEKRGAKDDLDH